MALTAWGLQPSARIWNALTVAKLVPLLLLVAAFAWRVSALAPAAPSPLRREQ